MKVEYRYFKAFIYDPDWTTTMCIFKCKNQVGIAWCSGNDAGWLIDRETIEEVRENHFEIQRFEAMVILGKDPEKVYKEVIANNTKKVKKNKRII